MKSRLLKRIRRRFAWHKRGALFIIRNIRTVKERQYRDWDGRDGIRYNLIRLAMGWLFAERFASHVMKRLLQRQSILVADLIRMRKEERNRKALDWNRRHPIQYHLSIED